MSVGIQYKKEVVIMDGKTKELTHATSELNLKIKALAVVLVGCLLVAPLTRAQGSNKLKIIEAT
jgi:hypothetical protein